MDLKCSGVSHRWALHRSKKRGATAAALKIAVLCGLTLSVASGCGDDFTGAEVVCHKGDTRECLGPGACKGAQECTATGSGFQPCQCSDGATQGGNGGQGSEPTMSGGGLAGLGGAPVDRETGGAPEGGNPSDGGSSGQGGQGGAAPHYECDPVTREGCLPTQNCSLDSGKPTCVKAGSKPPLATCTATTECAPGLGCHEGNCVPLCTQAEDCSVNTGYGCAFGISYDDIGIPFVGACTKTCDPVVQNCPTGQACYLGACATPKLNHAEGESCAEPRDCGAGLLCMSDARGAAPATCHPYCAISATDACGFGFACYPISELVAGAPANWGVCVTE